MTAMPISAPIPAPRHVDPPPDALAAPFGRGEDDPRSMTAFGLADRLAGAWSRNERRRGELDRLDAGIAAARRRLAASAAGRPLVEAHLARLLARRSAQVAAARADAALAAALAREWDARRAFRRAVVG